MASSSKDEESASGEETPFLAEFDTLEDYSKALLSQVMLATKASNQIPDQGDEYEYYASFPGFKTFANKMGSRVNRMISKLLRHQQLPCHWSTEGGRGQAEENFESLVEANDCLLERVSLLLDEASGASKTKQPALGEGVQRGTAQVASWNSKKDTTRSIGNSISFIHSKSVERPQLKFKHQVDNSQSPFIPLIRHKPNAKVPLPPVMDKLQNPTTLSALIGNTKEWVIGNQSNFHPYQHELTTLTYPDSQLQARESQLPASLEDTPLIMVTSPEQLEALRDELNQVSEFAVDLEHHSYRSYTGFVCLMQLSTRSQDYLIDTLELRHHMSTLLDPFTNPAIVKVFHGADMDIQWLQRDFGLYVVNMFDTGQASRALGLPKYSLAFLLQYCCEVKADKQFQLADWRIRPLPAEMTKYAREDTHYLLYIYDRMSNELIRRGNERGSLLRTVLDNSKALCALPYVKPAVTEDSYLKLYYRHKRKFNSQQLHCLQLLFKWRDDLARAEDESTGFVLPNHMLFQISEILPREPQGVLACCNPIPVLLRQQVQEVNMLVQKARSSPLTDVLPKRPKLLPKSPSTADSSSFVEDTDYSTKSREKVKVHALPVKKAKAVLTAFEDEKDSLPEGNREKCDAVWRAFSDILIQYCEPKPMTRQEVFQMHQTFPETPLASETTTPVLKRTLVTTPTQETVTPNDELVEKPKKKKKLSVREMEKNEESVSPTIKKKKKKNGNKKSPASEQLASFDYEGVSFSDYAKHGDPSTLEPYDPHSQAAAKGKSAPKSKVHQKFSERSQTYSHNKRGKKFKK